MSESSIQQSLMKWWCLAHRGLGVPDESLLMAFPLQGRRTAMNGARMKAEGMRAGTPDMLLAVARCGRHGLFLELKAEGGRLSDKQALMLAVLHTQGFYADVAYGFEHARNMIELYLKGCIS